MQFMNENWFKIYYAEHLKLKLSMMSVYKLPEGLFLLFTHTKATVMKGFF